MIVLTRLNNRRFVVNAELIKTVEETPDTIITLRDDEKFIVKETAAAVIDRAIAYARAIRTPLLAEI